MNHPLPEDAVAAAAIDGPLLVVATSETVARYAPAWAATAGQYRGCYRVSFTEPIRKKLVRSWPRRTRWPQRASLPWVLRLSLRLPLPQADRLDCRSLPSHLIRSAADFDRGWSRSW